MSITLRQCECFAVLAEELHFGRAAERLGIAQPPLSIQIAKLEEAIGAPLLERSTRVVTLTAAGREFAAAAAEVMQRIAAAAEDARRASRGEKGTLRVAYAGSVMFTHVADVIRRFRRERPDVDIQMIEMPSVQQIEAVVAGRADVAVPREPQPDARVTSQVFLRERLVLALPSGHALAGKRRIAPQRLSNEPMIHMPRSAHPLIHERIQVWLERGGVLLRVAQETAEWLTVVSLVGAGFGVGLVPESFRRFGRTGVVYRDLGGPVVRTPVAVCHRRGDSSPLVNAFASMLLHAEA